MSARPVTALLISGLQNDFCDEKGALAASGADVAGVREMLPEAQRVLTAARSGGFLVVHLPERGLCGGMSDSHAWRMQYTLNGWPNPIAAEGTWGEAFVEGLDPRPGEPVVHRYRPGALYDTRTTVLLRSAQVSRVILVGVETHRTILATTVQAACLDYEVVLPLQAVASTDPVLGLAAIQVLGSWARIVDVGDLLHELEAPVVEGPPGRSIDDRLEG